MILFIVMLFLALLVCLIIKLGKRNISRRYNILICIVVPMMIAVFFLCILGGSYARRLHDVHILEHLLSSVKISIYGNRVFATESERLAYIDSLNHKIDEVKEIEEYDKMISFILGRNQDLSIRINELQRILEEQRRRCNRLNVILQNDIKYKKEMCRPQYFIVYSQKCKSLPIQNIAFKLTDDLDSIQAVIIQVFQANRLNFVQTYQYKHKMNSFVLPNISSDSLYIKIGVVTKENGKNVWIYTKK